MGDPSDTPATTQCSPSPPPPPPATGSNEEKEVVDNALHALGFQYTHISPDEVSGRLAVTTTCCQPLKVLNGGVSALVAESIASLGAYVASGYRRVAGVQLSINHLKPARLGDHVEAQARPVQKGRTIQVWEVRILRIDPLTSESKDLVSTARVTLVSNLPTPEEMKGYAERVKKYAKL